MKKILIWGIIITIAIFLSYQTFAEEGKAVILFMQGDVKIKKANLMEWIDAKEGMPLSSGDILKTGDGSWVEIGLGKGYGNAVRIQEKTFVEITDLGPVQINLLQGELRALVERLNKDETFEIRTPMSVCGVRGTGWDTNTDGGKVVVDVYEEDVYFSGVAKGGRASEGTTVMAGKRAILVDPTRPILIEDLPIDRIKDWKRWKEDFIERRKTLEKGLEGKIESIEQGQKILEDMIKGKQGVFEKGDQDFIDKRIEKTTGESYP